MSATAARNIIILLILTLCPTLSALADKHSEPLVTEPIQLRGDLPSLERSIWLPPRAQRRGRTQLELRFEVSERVARERSTLSISIDGRTLRSVALDTLQHRGRVRIDLSEIEGGYHSLTFRARLRSEQDDCRGDEAYEKWLTLRKSSTLSWRSRRGRVEEAPENLEAIVQLWRATGQLDDALPKRAEGAELLFWLELSHLLQDWGVERSRDALYRLEPRLLEEDTRVRGELRKLKKLLEKHPESVAALGWDADDGTLLLAARDVSGWLEAIEVLRSEESRSRCSELPCLLAAQPEPTLTAQRTPERDALDIPLLERAGLPRGWLAKGPGDHQLSLQWRMEPGVTLNARPELTLHLRATREVRGRISLNMNGVPLSTWDLDVLSEEGAGHITVELPESLTSEPVWNIALRLRLEDIDDGAPCSALDPERVWLRITGESTLRVPREKTLSGGIAGYFRDASREGIPQLFAAEGDGTLRRTQIETLAALLYPFHAERPNERWQWTSTCPPASDSGGAMTRCFAIEHLEAGELWQPPGGRVLLPTKSTAWIALEAPGQLSARIPTRRGVEVTAPPFAALDVSAALFYDARWRPLGETSETTGVESLVEPEQPEAAAADAASTSPRLNTSPGVETISARLPWWWDPDTLWAMISGLIVLALIVWLRRSSRRARDGQLHVELHPEGVEAH